MIAFGFYKIAFVTISLLNLHSIDIYYKLKPSLIMHTLQNSSSSYSIGSTNYKDSWLLFNAIIQISLSCLKIEGRNSRDKPF